MVGYTDTLNLFVIQIREDEDHLRDQRRCRSILIRGEIRLDWT